MSRGRRRSRSRSTECCPKVQSNVQSLHFGFELLALGPSFSLLVQSDQWLCAFDGRKIALPGSDESTWPSLDFIHYHNDCVFERYA